MYKMGEGMRRSIKALGILVLACGSAIAQVGIVPTVYYAIVSGATGTIPVGVTLIPAAYMIGQYTHTISSTVNGPFSCVSNLPVIGLDGSFDNTNWVSLGAPIATFTGAPGAANKWTAVTVLYGAFPFLRMNVHRAFGGVTCATSINYVGSTTPVSFPTSLPISASQYQYARAAGSVFNVNPLPLAISWGVGGRLTLSGFTITNQDATTANTYTITLYNTPTVTPCNVGGAGTAEVIWVLPVPAQTTIQMGYSAIPLGSWPDPNDGAAGGLTNYNSAGSYSICITSSGGQLTTVMAASIAN